MDLIKKCADSLRNFSRDKYDIKLKATHAHELMAAYCGYASKNAMLADEDYPLSNLSQANIVVTMPDDFIDLRRNDLHDFPSELPDSYTLGEAFYACLFADERWTSETSPFRSFDKLARYLFENSDEYKVKYNNVFKFYRDISMHHIVDTAINKDDVIINVVHAYDTHDGDMLGAGASTIRLPRIAACIGYGKPQFDVGYWTGGARRKIELKEQQSWSA